MKRCNECSKQYSQMNKNPEGGCTPPVIRINNDPGCVLFHKVVFPASIGDDTTNPPSEFIGKYKNVLLAYEANNRSYLFSSDGMYTQLNNGVTDYEEATNLPQINGNTLIGDKTGTELGLQNELTAGANIQIDSDNVISATDTTYGPATDESIGLVKPGDGLSVQADGTLDIADVEEYAHFFDTVADMKVAENLVDGSYAHTLGYHTKNDGGEALYKIRTITNDDVVDEKFIIEMGDGSDNLVAELIYGKEVNVKALGAYGDGTHDDKAVLQAAFDKDVTVYMPKGEYLIASSVDIKNKVNDTESYVLKASEAKIVYTGNTYAFNIQNVANARLDFGVITSTTGGCLNMYATGGSNPYDYIQYVVVNFKVMQAGSGKDCVYASTIDNGWINEITFENGRFFGNAANGFHITYGCNNWNFNNIGFEGCVTGVYLKNDNTEHAMGHYTMHECRHSENITNYIKADGDGIVRDVFIFYSWKLDFYKVITNENCDDWYAYSRDSVGSHLVSGGWMFSNVQKTLEGGSNIGGGSNLNDFILPGDYNLNQTGYFNSATNKPNTKSLGKLTVQTFNNFRYQSCVYVLQTYTATDGHIFQRTFDGNSWTAWDLINGCACMEFDDNTNLNTLRHGSFVCTSSTKKATLSNIPSGVANLFRLDIERFGVQTSGTSCIQKIYDGDTNMYIRTSQGNTWSAWKQVSYVA